MSWGSTGISKGDVVVGHDRRRLMYVYDVVQQQDKVAFLCVWYQDGKLAESVFAAQVLRRASSGTGW